MMAPGTSHQFARRLLRFARRLAPLRSREWGDAMLAELDVVEGSWEGLRWSAGAARVLVKDTVLDLLTGRRSRTGSPLPQMNSKEGTMRRVALGVCGFSILTFLGLLLAPTFRQALDVSASGWKWAFDQPAVSSARIGRLAEQARHDRDTEFMAFAAMQLPPGDERRRLADEAVKLDPKLTWVYFVLANQMAPGPASDDLIGRVENWDPDNAAPHLLAAGQIAWGRGVVNLARVAQLESDKRWLQKMTAAFGAAKYDTYLAARLNLERSVMRRRRIDEPMLVLNGLSSHPLPNILLLRSYARHVLAAGQREEDVAHFDQAWQSYFAVGRFGHLMNMQGQTDIERLAGALIQSEAFMRLRPLAEKTHDRNASALLAMQSDELRQVQEKMSNQPNWIAVFVGNAMVGQTASLGMLVSLGLLLAVSMVWLLRRVRPAPSQGSSWFLTFAGTGGAVGLVLSSLTLYLSYKPFADVFARFIESSGTGEARSLFAFYALGYLPVLFNGLFDPQSKLWYFLLAGAAILLMDELLRVIRSSPKLSMAKMP